jgi:hypothetical protein
VTLQWSALLRVSFVLEPEGTLPVCGPLGTLSDMVPHSRYMTRALSRDGARKGEGGCGGHTDTHSEVLFPSCHDNQQAVTVACLPPVGNGVACNLSPVLW